MSSTRMKVPACHIELQGAAHGRQTKAILKGTPVFATIHSRRGHAPQRGGGSARAQPS